MNTQQTLQTLLLATALVLPLGQTARAGSVSLPNTFAPNTPARAAEVNANFAAVKTAVDDNHSRVAALENTIATLQTTVNNLLSRLQALENNSVTALDGKLELVTDGNGYPTARFTGVNVQVVNGVDQTTANGLGNLIIGYNADRDVAGGEVCSNGQYNNQTDCENNGATWAISHKSGSHNLVGGNQNSYSATGGLVFGSNNVVNRDFASVSGGYNNTASGPSSSVSGGSGNTASNSYSSVSGGYNNTASGSYSSVSGGNNNRASGSRSSVSGGVGNVASGVSSSVSGGYDNSARGNYSSVSGGYDNIAGGNYSSVSGGSYRSVSDPYNWRAGNLFEDF